MPTSGFGSGHRSIDNLYTVQLYTTGLRQAREIFGPMVAGLCDLNHRNDRGVDKFE